MKRISHFWVENCAVRHAKAGRPDVRFWSKGDISAVLIDVRFTLKADIVERDRHFRFVP